MRNRNQPIAVEGYPFIGLFAFITLAMGLLDWEFLTFIMFLLTLFSVYFFRNPERLVPDEPDLVVAPADGRVVFVGEVREERFLNEEVLKVGIFMNVLNVHVNRFPVAGKILDSYYSKGQFLNASLDKASEDNEQSGLLVEEEKGRKLVCVQIAGLIARRIVSYPEIGDTLDRGERYGLIRFGSRVDLYLPKNTDVRLRVGDKTIGGETIVGYLK